MQGLALAWESAEPRKGTLIPSKIMTAPIVFIRTVRHPGFARFLARIRPQTVSS